VLNLFIFSLHLSRKKTVFVITVIKKWKFLSPLFGVMLNAFSKAFPATHVERGGIGKS
jgi:hypothetical protein